MNAGRMTQDAGRILIVNPFGIGDVLFTTPLIESIKSNIPNSYIGYICNIRTVALLEANPNINKVFIFEKDEFRQLWKASKIKCLAKLFQFLKDIRSGQFDIAFDLSLAQEYGFFLTLCGIRERIGYNYRNRGIFLTKKLPLTGGYYQKHMADYYLALLELIGIMPAKETGLKVYIPQTVRKKADELLKEPYICMAPGAGASWGETSFRKHWPRDNFAEIAAHLSNEGKFNVVLLGSGQDKLICNYIKEKAPRSINLCSETSLMVSCAIIEKAELLLANDGGLIHIASALGTKAVSIFGPVDEKVYGPYQVKNHIVVTNKNINCRPCYKNFKIPPCSHRDCLEKISAEQVTEAVRRLVPLENKIF